MIKQPHEYLLQLYWAGVEAVRGKAAVFRQCQQHQFDHPVHVIAIGKAASDMLAGAHAALGKQIQSSLLITRHAHVSDEVRVYPNLTIHESSHPIPDISSQQAGKLLLDTIQKLPVADEILFLISGGASSLIEIPAKGLTIDDIQAINKILVASGLPIHAMNQWRTRFSQIKGGKLLNYVDGRRCRQYLISDVKNDDLHIIGSGPLVKCPADEKSLIELPALIHYHEKCEIEEAEIIGKSVNASIVASLDIAKAAIADKVLADGYPVYCIEDFVDGDVHDCASYFIEYLKNAKTGVHIWGGEPTVMLPENPGQGGRNQALCLHVSQLLEKEDAVTFMSCGTDGTDGPTDAAGAIVDHTTKELAEQQQINIAEELQKANAGEVLDAVDALIRTGPTGTNVMDLMIAIKS